MEAEDDDEEEEERVPKFDPAAGRLIRFVPRSVPHFDKRRKSHFSDSQQGDSKS